MLLRDSPSRAARAILSTPHPPSVEEPPIVTAPIKIFLSYRREDTAGHAGHLREDLAERYGEPNVFMESSG